MSLSLGTLRRAVSSVLPTPMQPGIRREILRLESRKSDLKIAALYEGEWWEDSAWYGLASLAYEIVRHYRPRAIVELGAFSGYSTFAMGLALRDLDEGGRLYAVDTWQGDDHTGPYAEPVYEKDVVVPLRMTFERARDEIPPGVDLLHIDGLHTFGATSRDLRTYRPLLNPNALVLFHDVRSHFLGMRLFWRTLGLRHEHYRVPYSNGLGIIRLPRAGAEVARSRRSSAPPPAPVADA